jgi:hypothetical protein
MGRFVVIADKLVLEPEEMEELIQVLLISGGRRQLLRRPLTFTSKHGMAEIETGTIRGASLQGMGNRPLFLYGGHNGLQEG